MQDNFTNDSIIEQLIKYLDDELSPEERASTELLLQNDHTIKERCNNLIAARNAVKLTGIQHKIKALHQQYYPLANEGENFNKETAKIVKTGFAGKKKMIASIAAIFILIIAGSAVYLYTTTSSESVYAENFISYKLPVLRGANNADALDSLFNAGNFSAVITLTETKQQLTQRDYFLQGLSNLQTANANGAIASLLALQKMNDSSSEKSFADESDYYLFLAYIKSGNISEAKNMLAKITSNPKHMYYAKAKEISKTALTILKWKQ